MALSAAGSADGASIQWPRRVDGPRAQDVLGIDVEPRRIAAVVLPGDDRPPRSVAGDRGEILGSGRGADGEAFVGPATVHDARSQDMLGVDIRGGRPGTIVLPCDDRPARAVRRDG